MDDKNHNNEVFTKLYHWVTPDRYWKPRDQNWYLSQAILFIVLIFLAALTGQFLLILALLSLLLMIFTYNSIPPRMIKVEITNRGIKVYDLLFKWRDITYFWFTEKSDSTWLERIQRKPGKKYRQINFDMPGKNPARISLLVDPSIEVAIINLLLDYLPYGESGEVSDDFLSRIVYGKHIPLGSYAQESPAARKVIEAEEYDSKE